MVVDLPDPLETDSRRRPDVAALLEQDYRAAVSALQKLQAKADYDEAMHKQNNETWIPVFFHRSDDGIIYDHEPSASVVPCYVWSGHFPEEGDITDASNVHGKGYCPWKYILQEKELQKQSSPLRPIGSETGLLSQP